jgi:hypothetical protein
MLAHGRLITPVRFDRKEHSDGERPGANMRQKPEWSLMRAVVSGVSMILTLPLVSELAAGPGGEDGKANSSRHHRDLPRPLAALNSRR